MPFKDKSDKIANNQKHNDRRPQDKAKAIRRMVNKISRLQAWNTDPKIDELLETARVDLANVVNLMYQQYRRVREQPKRTVALRLYKTTKLTIPEIAAKSGLCARTVNQVAKKAGLRRYNKRNKECQQQLEL